MNRIVIGILALTLVVCGQSALAAPGGGNGSPSGAHYNLNIIGVDNPKTADMTDSNRHSIFVALGRRDAAVKSRIYLTEGPFQVCDGNGFDTAYDCSGNVVGRNAGAVFQLPANYDGCPQESPNDPCWDDPTTYEIYIRGLGAPGGSVELTTCREAVSDGTTECSLETVDVRSYEGGKGGKNTQFVNETKKLTTACLDTMDDGNLDGFCDIRTGIFDSDLYYYLWEYNNKGLKLAQLRLYLLP